MTVGCGLLTPGMFFCRLFLRPRHTDHLFLDPKFPVLMRAFAGLGTYLCRSGRSTGRTSATEGRRSSWLLHTELLKDKPRAGKLRSKTNPEYRVQSVLVGSQVYMTSKMNHEEGQQARDKHHIIIRRHLKS